MPTITAVEMPAAPAAPAAALLRQPPRLRLLLLPC